MGSLADRLLAFLADKGRLVRMAEAGRKHVLANHTRSAVARYMLKEVKGCGADLRLHELSADR
jgi:hypothetical protein